MAAAPGRARALLLLLATLWLVACSEGKQPFVMPSFPVPPPPASTGATLKKELVFKGPTDELGDVFDRVTEALARGRFPDWAVYAFADDGFAVVTRMERIEADGRPTVPRFTVRRPLYGPIGFTIDDYRQLLFNATPGRYRVIALIVSARPFSPEHDRPPRLVVDANDVAKGKLPDEMRERKAPDGRCEVLVFEFTRPTDVAQPATLEPKASLTALEHVVRAGLWEDKDLR